jgi:5'-3' exoribonuclease 2
MLFVHRTERLLEAAKAPEAEDEILLHTSGFKPRYYAQKFQYFEKDKDKIRQYVEPFHASIIEDISMLFCRVVHSYTEGLCWVMLYYYRGCHSWTWYYPYHYAPMASDLHDLEQFDIKLDLGWSPLLVFVVLGHLFLFDVSV